MPLIIQYDHFKGVYAQLRDTCSIEEAQVLFNHRAQKERTRCVRPRCKRFVPPGSHDYCCHACRMMHQRKGRYRGMPQTVD